jgi:hypothetical protein
VSFLESLSAAISITPKKHVQRIICDLVLAAPGATNPDAVEPAGVMFSARAPHTGHCMWHL